MLVLSRSAIGRGVRGDVSKIVRAGREEAWVGNKFPLIYRRYVRIYDPHSVSPNGDLPRSPRSPRRGRHRVGRRDQEDTNNSIGSINYNRIGR